MLEVASSRTAVRGLAVVALLLALVLVGGATVTAQPADDQGGIPGSPYPADEADRPLHYLNFVGWPSTLDPALAYSEDAYEVLDLIVEPPLGYHALRRPYELVPRTATQIPTPVHVVLYENDAQRPEDLPEEAARFDYDQYFGAFEVPESAAHDAARYFRYYGLLDEACWREQDMLQTYFTRLLDNTRDINDGRHLAIVGAKADLAEATTILMRLYEELEHGVSGCGFKALDTYPFSTPAEWADAFAAWADDIDNDEVETAASEMASTVSAATFRVQVAASSLPELPIWLADALGYRYVVDVAITPGIHYQPHPCFARDKNDRFRYHGGWKTDIAEFRDLLRTLYYTPELSEVLERTLRRRLSRNGRWNPDELLELTYPTDLAKLETGTRELIAEDYVLQIKRLAYECPIGELLERHLDGFLWYSNELFIDWDNEESMREELMPGVAAEDRPYLPFRSDFECAEFPGAWVLDRYSYRIALTQPYRPFLNWLTMSFFGPLPWEVLSLYAQPALEGSYVWIANAPIGTGPLMLTAMDEEQLRVERNPNFNPRGPKDGAAPPAVVDANGNGKLDGDETYWDDRNGNGKYDAFDTFGRMLEGLYFEDVNRNSRWDDGEHWYELPASHRTIYPLAGGPEDAMTGLLDDAGRRLPLIDGFVASYIAETDEEYWERFLDGWYDQATITPAIVDDVIEFDSRGRPRLQRELADRGIKLRTTTTMSTSYWAFNMLDPVIGGYSDGARKLRQAISIALDTDAMMDTLHQRGMTAHGPLPPTIFGGPRLTDDDYFETPSDINTVVYNAIPVRRSGRVVGYRAERKPIADAKRLMREAGWPDGVNGDGDRLTIRFDTFWTDESWLDWIVAQFAKLGITLEIVPADTDEYDLKLAAGDFQLVQAGWNADYPDAENFLQLLYGPNHLAPTPTDWSWGGVNTANYMSRDYDRVFLKLENMPDGAARRALIDEAVDIAREDCPWIWGIFPESWWLEHGWLDTRKSNLLSPVASAGWRIDTDARNAYRKERAGR